MLTSTTDINHQPLLEALPTRETTLGEGIRIRRALPNRLRRLVGAWTFLDHFGPITLAADSKGMRVGPHPHTGLQTVSWLYAGEMLHRDCLGFKQIIRPGQLNLMTAGHGISHSEESPPERTPSLHGLQFWIALPDKVRHMDSSFEHHAELPIIERDGYRVTVVIGEAFDERSPARVHSPLAGMDLQFTDTGARTLPLNPGFEHAILLTEGELEVAGTRMDQATLYYLGSGRESLVLNCSKPARAFLFGGTPLNEEVLLWWNFVARNTEEMQSARTDWEAHAPRFGEVQGYDGPRLTAPELTGRLLRR
ncbi:MAG TPA: pirin family protein [Gammaproteobacteria bacterium]|nr:pirin family protein [Gammaproteobacteria bacterium]